VEHFTI